MKKKSNPNRSSGVLLHITSLPGPYGIGEIGIESKKFVDNLVSMGQGYWQILPTNYPEQCNSPYDTNSAFAQNPFLISLDDLLEDELIKSSDLEPIPTFSKRRIDYNKVKNWKYPILKKAASNFQLKKDQKFSDYKDFCNEQKFWLNDYAVFMVIKEIQKKRDWSFWSKGLKEINGEDIKKVEDQFKSEIECIKILQYFFDRQWKQLKKYANQRGIKLIGDIPIYVSFNSADVWMNKSLFKLDENCKMLFQSGVPPDHFADSGQLWGHPIYNWESHFKSGFNWWIERIKYLRRNVDFVRIDHFNGFAKYWEVPIVDKDASRGRWVLAKGMELLQKLYMSMEEVNLIAEDLGEASKDALVIREKYDIPGMSILQYMLNGKENAWYDVEKTVLYTGTHDNDTILGWYDHIRKNLSKKELESVKLILNIDPKEVNWSMIEYSLHSNAYLVIVPIQDILGLSSNARMNKPGTVSKKNWSWRMDPSELSSSKVNRMKNYTMESNRG